VPRGAMVSGHPVRRLSGNGGTFGIINITIPWDDCVPHFLISA